MTKSLKIKCASCGYENSFEQPYAYHAGFGNQGFLYNDAGNLTLIWSSFDPDYEKIIGRKHPWALTAEEQNRLENLLRPAPSGGAWRFANHARCGQCSRSIHGSITETIYYLRYPDSLNLDPGPHSRRFADCLLLTP
ncbi:MAG TPA: hypothetical protein VFS04_02265 [Alphaproteobacteria bacterium]|nr:hypothetical protein [Alphaproteobacteria bacterium]